jgi:hypothetical protein
MSTEVTIAAALETAFKAIAESDLGMSSTDQVYDYLFEDHDKQTPETYLIDAGVINAVGFDVMFSEDPFYSTAIGERNGANRTYTVAVEVYRPTSAGRAAVKAALRKLVGAIGSVGWTALHCDEFSEISTNVRFQTVSGVAGQDGMMVGVADFTCNELNPTH